MEKTIARLAEAINASGLSYAELEKHTKIAKSSLQRYATGKTKKIPIDAIQVIAKATGTSAAWIMGCTDEEVQKKNDVCYMDIGHRIRYKREALGLSQDELAKRLGYKSRSSINKIELGLNDITQSKIVAFAKALGTTPSYLMGWTEDGEEKKNDTTTDIILRLRQDALFLDVVNGLASLSSEQLQAVKTLLC